jgi:myo-inositol-1(or 4)-monophosphatase
MPNATDAPANLLHTARAAADAAAAIHRKWSHRVAPAEAVDKGRSDFVSRVDREAQDAALAVIQERHPQHRILAEEEGVGPDGPERWTGAGDEGRPLWIVDPLDGTTNFLHGHPMYAASVGVTVDGRPVAGAVVAPATGEEWWASAGGGAFRNGEPIRVSTVGSLPLALVGTGFPFKRPDLVPTYLEQFRRILLRSSGIRRGGAAALDLCYLAQGALDAFWEAHLSPWDVAGGLAILSEAGGIWMRQDGSPLAPAEGGSVLAANGPALLGELQALLREG